MNRQAAELLCLHSSFCLYTKENVTQIELLIKERAKYWLGVGAQPSDTVRALLKKGGVL